LALQEDVHLDLTVFFASLRVPNISAPIQISYYDDTLFIVIVVK
jgi:hypothetical protein